MRRNRRIETIVETHEVWVIKRSRGQTLALCVSCADQPAMLTSEAAALLYGLSLGALDGWVKAGGVHFQESPGGELFVCPASLSVAIRRESTPERHVTPALTSKEFMP